MAAHKFELQALVAPRRKKMFVIFILGLEYLALRFHRPLDKKGEHFLDTFFDPPLLAKKWGIGVSWLEFLAQKFP